MNVLYSYGSINLAIEVGINVVKQCAKNKIHVHVVGRSRGHRFSVNGLSLVFRDTIRHDFFRKITICGVTGSHEALFVNEERVYNS
jgi:hypothetical protein